MCDRERTGQGRMVGCFYAMNGMKLHEILTGKKEAYDAISSRRE